MGGGTTGGGDESRWEAIVALLVEGIESVPVTGLIGTEVGIVGAWCRMGITLVSVYTSPVETDERVAKDFADMADNPRGGTSGNSRGRIGDDWAD